MMSLDSVFFAKGYAPTLDELLRDVGADSPEELGEKIKERCRMLYRTAKESRRVYLAHRNAGSIHEFIVCDSSDFPQSLVNLGYGNCALTVIDEHSPDVFFLIFHDRLPEKYFSIAAAHEITELYENRRGTGLSEGHLIASRAELLEAKDRGLETEYLGFVGKNFPGKYRELMEIKRTLRKDLTTRAR